MQNSDLYRFATNNFWSSDGCNSALQKIKLCRGHMFSNAVKIKIFISNCTILCIYKIIENCRKHPSIQNYRHAKFRKCEIKSKLHLTYLRNRQEGSQHAF